MAPGGWEPLGPPGGLGTPRGSAGPTSAPTPAHLTHQNLPGAQPITLLTPSTPARLHLLQSGRSRFLLLRVQNQAHYGTLLTQLTNAKYRPRVCGKSQSKSAVSQARYHLFRARLCAVIALVSPRSLAVMPKVWLSWAGCFANHSPTHRRTDRPTTAAVPGPSHPWARWGRCCAGR